MAIEAEWHENYRKYLILCPIVDSFNLSYNLKL